MNVYVVVDQGGGLKVFDSLDRASSWIFTDDPDATMDLANSKYPYYRYVGNFTYHVHAREVNAC